MTMAMPQRQSHIIKQKTGPDDPELHATLEEALGQLLPDDLISIADELAARHERTFRLLALPPFPKQVPLADICRAVTHTRANARLLQEHLSSIAFDGLAGDLLHGADPGPVRLANCVMKLNALDTRLSVEFASGLMHNTRPDRYWLWTRWMWDPTSGSGILPLLAGSVHNLMTENLAEGYARAGSVIAMCMRFAEGTGLLVPALVDDARRGVFAPSAFLSCAYAVYLYGTTGWRLSRDFHGLLPPLPDLARRLLGLPKAARRPPAADT
jgi:hypothetical protein